MAITRAQQVRQMLEDGGMLVSPSKDGKRPGYRNPNEDRAREEAANRREAAIQEQRRQTVDVRREPTGSYDEAGLDVRKTGKDDDPYEGTTQMGFVDDEPIKPIKDDTTKDFRDKPFEPPTFPPGAAFFTDIFKKPLQAGMTYDRNYFVDRVLKAGRIGITPLEFSRLTPEEQEEVFDKFTELRNAGLTDAVGNLKSGVRREMIPFTDKYGKTTMREQIIDNRDDGPSETIKLISDPINSTDPTDPNQTTDVFSGIAPAFAGSIFDFDKLRREQEEEEEQFAADGGRIGFDNGGYTFEQFMQDKYNVDEFMNQEQLKKLYEKMMKEKEVREQKTMAADGGRIGAMEGGIMDLETGRQMYFLGKLVKKATRAVKKIVKSPIGKAALMFGIPGTGIGGLFGRASFGTAAKGLFGKYGIAQTLGMQGISPGTLGGKTPGLRALLKRAIGSAKDNPIITSALTFGGLSLFGDEKNKQANLDEGPELTMEELLAIRNNPFGTIMPSAAGSEFKFAADGGLMRMGYQEGSKEPVAKKTMPLLDMGGKEMDLRDDGGFVPIGRMEKADDVPARLSKNEFVFTADAVRNAGEGDVDKGAEVMYNMMKNLESGGQVSEESQGLEGARDMFQTSKRLEEVL